VIPTAAEQRLYGIGQRENSSQNRQDVVKICGLRGCIVRWHDQRMARAGLQGCPIRGWSARLSNQNAQGRGSDAKERLDRVVLEANRHYWDTVRLPRLQRIIFDNTLTQTEAVELLKSRLSQRWSPGRGSAMMPTWLPTRSTPSKRATCCGRLAIPRGWRSPSSPPRSGTSRRPCSARCWFSGLHLVCAR
jgi:hypothetical protein